VLRRFDIATCGVVGVQREPILTLVVRETLQWVTLSLLGDHHDYLSAIPMDVKQLGVLGVGRNNGEIHTLDNPRYKGDAELFLEHRPHCILPDFRKVGLHQSQLSIVPGNMNGPRDWQPHESYDCRSMRVDRFVNPGNRVFETHLALVCGYRLVQLDCRS
jgi:hypothetical protein